MAALLSGGCLTFCHRLNHVPRDEADRDRLFGGVAMHAASVKAVFGDVAKTGAEKPGLALAEVMIAGVAVGIDLPLCVVADTAVLPFVVRARLARRNQYRYAVPQDEGEAVCWWEATAKDLSPEFMAIYLVAAEIHRKRGTSATYVEQEVLCTMISKSVRERWLPCPPPESALAEMREGPAPRYGRSKSIWAAVECRGCTPEEAKRIWAEASETVTAGLEGRAVPISEK